MKGVNGQGNRSLSLALQLFVSSALITQQCCNYTAEDMMAFSYERLVGWLMDDWYLVVTGRGAPAQLGEGW